jgi:hypothetical protein
MRARVSNLPDEDHVMRYVPWTRLRKDEDDNVLGFLPQAFELKLDEDALSVNWIEFYDGDWQTKIRDSVKAIRRSFDREIGKKSAFGIAKIRRVKEICLEAGVRVRIVHEPEERNPAHSTMRRLPREDLNLLQALADDAFVDLIHNVSVA